MGCRSLDTVLLHGKAEDLSMKKLAALPQSAFLRRVFKRTLIIFAIGYFLNGFPFYKLQNGEFQMIDFSGIRIMGVLQRIAICYFLASLMIYYFKKRTVLFGSFVILFLYWGLLYYFGDPGVPYSLEGNAVRKLDLQLFHAKVLYQGFKDFKEVCPSFDGANFNNIYQNA